MTLQTRKDKRRLFFICSDTEDLSSAGSVKGSSCRTWICCWTGRTSTACCWELSATSCSAWSRTPRTRMHRFSWGSWRPRWPTDSTASTRHVESRKTDAASRTQTVVGLRDPDCGRPQQHVFLKSSRLLFLTFVFFGRTLEEKIKQKFFKFFILFINLTYANVSDPGELIRVVVCHFDLQRQETRTFSNVFCFFDCWLNKLSSLLFLYLLCYS